MICQRVNLTLLKKYSLSNFLLFQNQNIPNLKSKAIRLRSLLLRNIHNRVKPSRKWGFVSFIPLFSYWSSSNVSEGALALIPKEVFRKDVLKKKQGTIRWLLTFIWDIFRTCFRFVQITLVFTPLILTYPLRYTSSTLNTLWIYFLVWTLEHLGATFIKLGQWTSTRRDVFSDELCDIFSKLHSNTSVHSWYMTKKKLRLAFGKRWRMLFEKFEQEPIGSGCVGQVCIAVYGYLDRYGHTNSD